ncbi:MAG: alpha-E domain-containing protein [Neomegalonema sp.]|nr:alpha-E domain-containing protein [Neomegalonema sp.]
MLSRTADCLFWIARYVERAETMARLVDTARRMGQIPVAEGGHRDEWSSVLSAAGCAPAFFERFDKATRSKVSHFLLLDRENPSSVVSCLEYARANARSVRGAVTKEMWETLNESWIESRVLSETLLDNGQLQPFLDWVKQRGALFRGAADATMLHDDGFDFLRLGGYIERIDSTARLLDVTTPQVDGAFVPDDADLYEWIAVLRGGGVYLAYHTTYRAEYDPRRIADFLLLNRACPRSILFCSNQINEHLGHLSRIYGARGRCQHRALQILTSYVDTSIDLIMARGLHGFISGAIAANNDLAMLIAETYHFAPAPLDLSIEAAEGAAAVEEAKAADDALKEDAAKDGEVAGRDLPSLSQSQSQQSGSGAFVAV